MSTTRPGGRSAEVRRRVLEAAHGLAAEKGIAAVTIPEIAQRAAVAPTSLYRRWGDLETLLLDMAVERLGDRSPLPDEGSAAADLVAWSVRIAEGLASSREPSFLSVLLSSRDLPRERRAEALRPRLEQLEAMLRRGLDRGERAPTAEDVIDHVLAPLYVRSLLGLPTGRDVAERLAVSLLEATSAA